MNRSDLNSYYVQYHNTTAEEYRAYLEKLETLGFTCYARREVNGNLFATYTDGYNLLSVNYAKFYQITRIASETAAGNYGMAGFWVVVILIISFVIVAAINIVSGKGMKMGRWM